MPKLDVPLQLAPVFKPKIWGRTDLAPLFTQQESTGINLPADSAFGGIETGGNEPIGEVWLTDDEATFMNAPLAGLTLKEAVEQCGAQLLGRSSKNRRFPILAKYLYTNGWLSIQVHPDDDYASRHEPGNVGKYEMWYVLQAKREASILLGLKPGVNRYVLQAALEKGKSRDLLNKFKPKVGEAIFVPPGTVHAIGPGLVLFEAEQNSDLTYRLDDFGRVGSDGKPRPLHWDKGLDVIQSNEGPYRNLPNVRVREPYGSRRFVVSCRHFAVEELTVRKLAAFHGRPGRVEVLSVLSGRGRVETDLGWLGYSAGNTWVIPPDIRPYRLVPKEVTNFLKFYVPDKTRDFRRFLSRRGIRAEKTKKLVFD